MTASALAVPLATADVKDGALIGIWINEGEIFDSCDCHRLVWPASVITYQPGPDIYECPLSID